MLCQYLFSISILPILSNNFKLDESIPLAYNKYQRNKIFLFLKEKNHDYCKY